jgi:hypothetical protein
MPGVFISYRRDDTGGYAGRLYDALATRFGRSRVFMDIDTLEPGLDFVEVLGKAIDSSDVFLALIGPRWLSAVDMAGNPRIQNPEDFVRLEITMALARQGLLVIPVRLGNVAMPPSYVLPDPLKPLARRHAFEISDERWEFDNRRLISVLEKVVKPLRRWPRGPTILIVLILIIALLILIF